MIMKQHFNIQTMFVCLCSLLMAIGFNSCLSDGDETISLEFGNPKKMLVGQWIITEIGRKGGSSNTPAPKGWKPGTEICFYDDGTYTDSNDDDKEKRHPWRVRGSEPVWGGIDLDGDEFDFVYWGDGGGEISYNDPNVPSGPTWIIGFEPTDDDDVKPGTGTKPEPEPEEKWVEMDMIKSIRKMTHSEYYDTDYVYSFNYYDNGRIKTYKITDYERNRDLYAYEYMYEENSVTINGIRFGLPITLSMNKYGFVDEHIKYESDRILQSVETWGGDWITIRRTDNVIMWGDHIQYHLSPYSNNANIDINCFISVGGGYGNIYIEEIGDGMYDNYLMAVGLAGEIPPYIIDRGYEVYSLYTHTVMDDFDFEVNSSKMVKKIHYNCYHAGEIYEEITLSIEYEKKNILQK